MYGIVAYNFKKYVTENYGRPAWREISQDRPTYLASQIYDDDEVISLIQKFSKTQDLDLQNLLVSYVSILPNHWPIPIGC